MLILNSNEYWVCGGNGKKDVYEDESMQQKKILATDLKNLLVLNIFIQNWIRNIPLPIASKYLWYNKGFGLDSLILGSPLYCLYMLKKTRFVEHATMHC